MFCAKKVTKLPDLTVLTLRLNDYRLPGSVWPYLSPEAGGGVGYGGLVQVGLEGGDGEPAGGGTRSVHRQRRDLHLVLASVLQACNNTAKL
jgi:hypothetical protein